MNKNFYKAFTLLGFIFCVHGSSDDPLTQLDKFYTPYKEHVSLTPNLIVEIGTDEYTRITRNNNGSICLKILTDQKGDECVAIGGISFFKQTAISGDLIVIGDLVLDSKEPLDKFFEKIALNFNILWVSYTK